jgi:hypothetical protein
VLVKFTYSKCGKLNVIAVITAFFLWSFMFKFMKYLFNSDCTYYCPTCHRVTDEYGNELPVCKCGQKLKYSDRISESKRQILEIKDEINEED